MTREQAIIKAFIAGKPVAPAQPASIMGRVRANPSAESPEPGRFGFSISNQSMEQLAKRREDTEAAEQRREERGGEKVDRDAMRRDMLGAARLAKVKAQAKFNSQNVAKVKHGGPSSFEEKMRRAERMRREEF